MNGAKGSAEQQAWEAVGRRVGVHSEPCINGPDLSVFRADVMEKMGDRQGLEQLAYRHLGMGDIDLVKSFLGKIGGLKDGEIPAHLLEQTARAALAGCHISVARILITELRRINPSADVSAFRRELQQQRDNPYELLARRVKLADFHGLFQMIEAREMTPQEWEELGDKIFAQDSNMWNAYEAYAMASAGQGVEVQPSRYQPKHTLLKRFCKRLGDACLRGKFCIDEARNYYKAINDAEGLLACSEGYKERTINAYHWREQMGLLNEAEQSSMDIGLPPSKEWYRDIAERVRMGHRHLILKKADLREELRELGDAWLKRYQWRIANDEHHFHDNESSDYLEAATTCYKSSKDPARLKLMGDMWYLVDRGNVLSVEELYNAAGHTPVDPTYYWHLGAAHSRDTHYGKATPEKVKAAFAAFLQCIELGGSIEEIERHEIECRRDDAQKNPYSKTTTFPDVDLKTFSLAA